MAEKAKDFKTVKKMNRKQSEVARSNIQVNQLIQRVQRFALADGDDEKAEMSGAQVNAATMLLGKTLPNLTAAELTADITTNQSATEQTLTAISAINDLTHIAKSKAVEQELKH